MDRDNLIEKKTPDYLKITEDNHKKIQDNFTIGSAIYKIVTDAVPAIFGLLFIFICETINIVFIGKFNDPALISGIGIGTLYFNATGYILGVGLIGGVDTLCSQTYGAKKFVLMGIFVNIARFIVTLFFLLVSVPFIVYSREFMEFLGQDEIVVVAASSFCHSMIPSLFFALQFNTSLRYLQAQDVFLPGMVITASTAILHPIWCHLLINVWEIGIMGAGFAMTITQILNFIIISLYIHYKTPTPASYFFFNRECFQLDLIWDYLCKAVPAAILLTADMLGFEILTLMSSYMSANALASNVCLFNFITLIFMMPFGLSFASTTMVGNSIGANNVKAAKKYALAAIITGACLIGTITLLVYIYQYDIPFMYTSDPIIAHSVTSLLKIYVCFSVTDAIQIVLHGIIKGLGKQNLASVICLIVLYPINIPLAYCFGFVWGYGLEGLWYAQLISVYLLASSYALICIFLNWEKVAHKALKEFNKEEGELEKRRSSKGIIKIN